MLENTTSEDIIKIVDHMKDIITPIGVEVYKIYYKQMVYTGIFETIIDILVIIGVPVIIYYLLKHKEKTLSFYYWIEAHDLENVFKFVCVILVICYAAMFLSAVDCFPNDVLHIINPDYYIIQNLLHG